MALARSPYTTVGRCDGLPRLDLRTPPGFCVGLVADGFRFPRGVLPLADGDLLVVDMGGWTPGKGSLWRLHRTGNDYQRRRLLAGLDRPNGIALGPDGKVYLGLVGRVIRFDLGREQPLPEDVIGGNSAIPPLPGTGRHPLSQLVFDREGRLYVNVGSASDNCEGPGGVAPTASQACAERSGSEARGVIRRYEFTWPAGQIAAGREYARGLRNSMALAVHPDTGELWQGENSRDAIHVRDPALDDAQLPHDELNRIVDGGDYGWPYCYDQNVSAPDYPGWDCHAMTPPVRLLAPHAAPLGMAFYQGGQFPAAYRGALLIGYHGYRDPGHRVMSLAFDAKGQPRGEPQPLIDGWEAAPGHPMGAPVDVRVGADGAVYLSEDRNGTVLRLAYTGPGK